MPTENRSSNTELSKIVTEALVGMVSGVTGMKPPADEPLPGFIQAPIDRAVTRISGLLAQPAPQPHPDPIAWMVGTAFWWTKEEAERDAADTGLPIVGLGPMAGVAPAEQHQGEPVELPERLPLDSEFSTYGLGKIQGWNDYHAAAAKLGPLYTHADPAEVERLRAELAGTTAESQRRRNCCADLIEERDTLRRERRKMDQALSACANERDALRAQVDKLEAMLRKVAGYNWANVDPEDRARTRAELRDMLSASAEPSAPNDCAICRDLGNQCMECEEGEFREWADRHFAAADYRKTDAGVFIQDWMRHAYGAWCARGAAIYKKDCRQ